MIARNVQPLRKSHNRTKTIAPEAAALQALGGPFCDVCFASLPPPPFHSDQESGGSDYICCGEAYCPYCGVKAKNVCPHLIAKSTSGKWHLLGLPEIPPGDLPNPNPLAPHSILGLSHHFKSDHLRGAYDILDDLFGASWDGHPIRQIPTSMLIIYMIYPDVWAKVRTPSGATNQYLFRESADGIAQDMEQLFQDIPDAFHRLESQPCPFAEYLQMAAALPENGSKTAPERINFLHYSPCSNYLVVLGRKAGEIWDTSGDTPKRIASFAATCRPNQQYTVADFPESGDTIRLWCSIFSGHNIDNPCLVEIRSLEDGRLLTTELQKPSEYVKELAINARSQRDSLHAGTTDISINGSKISLRPHTDEERKARYSFSIPLRRPAHFLSVASDGETFVTGSDRVFCFWRIPAGVLQEAASAGT